MADPTPSPWFVAVSTELDRSHSGNIIIHTPKDLVVAICDVSKTIPYEQCIANAKLMRAAPQMLFALAYARAVAVTGTDLARELDKAIQATKELQ